MKTKSRIVATQQSFPVCVRRRMRDVSFCSPIASSVVQLRIVESSINNIIEYCVCATVSYCFAPRLLAQASYGWHFRTPNASELI